MPSKKQVLRVYAWAATLGHAYQNRLATGLRAAQLQKCRSLQPASSTKGDPKRTHMHALLQSCGTGLRALTACLRISDWPRRLVSNFAHITAGLGGPKMQLAHLIGSHQWEMPSCTGFSGFAWGLITSQLRERERGNSTCPFSQHWLMRTCPCLSHLPN